MPNKPKIVHHPKTGEMVYGRVLQVGEKTKSTDVYSFYTGTWAPAPRPGLLVDSVSETSMYVRPAELPASLKILTTAGESTYVLADV